MNDYKPTFTITNEMLQLVFSIGENLSKLNNTDNLSKLPRVRKTSRIKSVHSSLAIEANSLSLDQVKDVLDGKTVIGPRKEIQEVKNAFEATENLSRYNANSLQDLLKSHSIMMKGLVDEPGILRRVEEGVFDGNKIVHLAPTAKMVSSLMNQLFLWLKDSDTHPLIKSSVFHYEFEFIHPFNDGNGRIGRLWQNVILSKWKPIFEWIPIESIIKERQEEYYQSLSTSNKNGDSNVFIVFMLNAINDSIINMIVSTSKAISHANDKVTKLLGVLQFDFALSTKELMGLLNLKSREAFRINYLKPALEAGLVVMILPDSPNSKNQKYLKN
jgi:Fic family protein